MNTLKQILRGSALVILSLLLSGAVYGQKQMKGEEYDHSILARQKNAIEMAKVENRSLHQELKMNKKVEKANRKEIRSSLEESQAYLQELYDDYFENKEMQKHIDGVTKHQKEALRNLGLLDKELANSIPDYKMARKYATNLHQEMKQAELQQKELMRHRMVAEAGEPQEE